MEQTRKKVSYRTVLSTCLSFLNDVMASEPFLKERSDAVKMSETPYPTNGSGKNLAKDTGIKKAGIPRKVGFFSDFLSPLEHFLCIALGENEFIFSDLVLERPDFSMTHF